MTDCACTTFPASLGNVRFGAAVLVDDGLLNTPFGGFGRYANLLQQSEGLSQSPWQDYGSPTVNANAALAPDGSQTADEIVSATPE